MIFYLSQAATAVQTAAAFSTSFARPFGSPLGAALGRQLTAMIAASRQPAWPGFALYLEELMLVAVILVSPVVLKGQPAWRDSFQAMQGWLVRLLARPAGPRAPELRGVALAAATLAPPPLNAHGALHDLVRGLEASGGFIAVMQGTSCAVIASVNSLPVGQRLELAAQVDGGELRLAGPEPQTAERESLPLAHCEADFERLVEQALRQLSDYTRLGQSGLVDALRIERPSQIERGKVARQILADAIDSLRPGGAQSSGVLAREWQAYTILHDAYVEDVPNRDIMSKLYISEGTFNRQRRKAVRAVAAAIWELHRPAAEPCPRVADSPGQLAAWSL